MEIVEITNSEVQLPYLYIFLDEGGNFNFSEKGSKYFTLTAVTAARPFLWDAELMALKYDELERGSTAEYFHATEDKQIVRNRVFAIIANNLDALRIDCIIAEKRKARPELQPEDKLYPRMLGYLLRYVLRRVDVNAYTSVLVITDAIPIRAKREAIEKAVIETLTGMLPKRMRWRVLHHDSKSCMSLQVVDYCNWAIYRKWDRGDERSYALIQQAIRSEFDIFRNGDTYYY